MNRKQVKGKRCIGVVEGEKKALELLSLSPHPFVLELLYSMKDAENLYLIATFGFKTDKNEL